jgi:hypothetical protein
VFIKENEYVATKKGENDNMISNNVSNQMIAQTIKISNPLIEQEAMTKGEIWIKACQDRIDKGMSLNCLLLGEPGSGKSWASLKLAELMDMSEDGFSHERIVFGTKDFMMAIKKAKKGQAIIYEEVGVNWSSRQWYKQFGQNALLQTIRYKNLFFIMNCPNIKFLDKQASSLVHYTFQMKSINQSEKFSVMRPIRLETDGQMGITKQQYPLIDGVLIPEIKVTAPSVKLRNKYEKLAKAYKDGLNADLLAQELANEKAEMISRGIAKNA